MMSLLVNTRLQATRLKTGHSPGLAEHHQGPNVSCPHQKTAALAISVKKMKPQIIVFLKRKLFNHDIIRTLQISTEIQGREMKVFDSGDCCFHLFSYQQSKLVGDSLPVMFE